MKFATSWTARGCSGFTRPTHQCTGSSARRETSDLDQVRVKFLAEHTHSEDEVRYFVDGSGLFWFHQADAPVYRVKCEKGDFRSGSGSGEVPCRAHAQRG